MPAMVQIFISYQPELMDSENMDRSSAKIDERAFNPQGFIRGGSITYRQ